VHFLALEWSLAFGEASEMREALHPTLNPTSELKFGEFCGHRSFVMKSVRFILNQSGEMSLGGRAKHGVTFPKLEIIK